MLLSDDDFTIMWHLKCEQSDDDDTIEFDDHSILFDDEFITLHDEIIVLFDDEIVIHELEIGQLFHDED